MVVTYGKDCCGFAAPLLASSMSFAAAIAAATAFSASLLPVLPQMIVCEALSYKCVRP
jgi:hypothetical protein